MRRYIATTRRLARYFNPRTPCGVRRYIATTRRLARYFNPRTPCGVRLSRAAAAASTKRFQSTHPLRGATPPSAPCPRPAPISIHAPLAGCDRVTAWRELGTNYFNPRTPCGVRRAASSRTGCLSPISIHAPLAGCDLSGQEYADQRRDFNPRTPCGVRRSNRIVRIVHRTDFNPRTPCGVRHWPWCCLLLPSEFQSTHPLRGATAAAFVILAALYDFNPRTPCGVRPRLERRFGGLANFNPRTPCGVRHDQILLVNQPFLISIHAPLAGCDTIRYCLLTSRFLFQSTHPLRGATESYINRGWITMISIHAPLAGCDPTALEQALDEAISIHAPLAGCDIASPLTVGGMVISIHAPLAGCDTCWGSIRPRVRYFNPRTPCGVRPTGLIIAQLPLRFQSTHPLRGATSQKCG